MLTSLEVIRKLADYTLVAGAPQELVGGASGIDVSGFNKLSFVLENTGLNPVTALDVFWSDDAAHTQWSPRDASVTFVALAPGASIIVNFWDITSFGMRLSVTSANGTTVRLSMTGKV